MTKEIPTAQQEEQNYCELCGIDVPASIELKRFGKYFCSKEHLNEYVTTRQKSIGVTGDNSNTDNRHYRQLEDDYQQEEPRRTRWFRGLEGGDGCC